MKNDIHQISRYHRKNISQTKSFITPERKSSLNTCLMEGSRESEGGVLVPVKRSVSTFNEEKSLILGRIILHILTM